jgi:hypothetical protein
LPTKPTYQDKTSGESLSGFESHLIKLEEKNYLPNVQLAA